MSPAPPSSSRLVAIDWMRGFVMVLMALDHSSGVLNSGRLAHDSGFDLTGFGLSPPPDPLPVAQFLTRWITHLCAPTFLFLSGTSLALSTTRRQQAGATAGEIDRHLYVRGALLLGFEVLWFSPLLSGGGGGLALVLQVLFAIGMGLIAMAPLRRLPGWVLVSLGLGWFVGGEALTLGMAGAGTQPSTGTLILLAPGGIPGGEVLYPVLPWLAMMILGWAFGQYLARSGGSGAARLCGVAGACSLAVFALVRGVNAYGNMGLLRRNDSLHEWLFVSKYPPSLSFASLELGLMGLALGALLVLQQRVAKPRANNPLLILGQTALFFYLLHFHLLAIAGVALGWIGSRGLLETYVAALVVTATLVPICRGYRAYKRRNPASWAQYV